MIPKWLIDVWEGFVRNLKSLSFVDIIDILCVAILIYYVYKFIRDRRAGKLALGVAFIVFFLILSELLEMHALQFILTNVFQVGLITLVILFQPELRSALEKMGGESIKSFRSIGELRVAGETETLIDSVCEAVTDMASSRTGALLVFEGTTKLGDLILTGTVINADPSSFLIKNIFFNRSPLHDGAVIVRDGKLYAAGCLLPLSAKSDIVKDLGTRHRAAIGMSENSDALVVVVSEETGVISVARDGVLTRGYSAQKLDKELRGFLLPEAESNKVGKAVRRIAQNRKKTAKKETAGKQVSLPMKETTNKQNGKKGGKQL